MKINLASADANILGHLYRSGTKYLISNVCSTVLLDEFVYGEVNRRLRDIARELDQDLASDSFISLVKRSDLKRDALLSLYEANRKDMNSLFLPKDEGEKRAITLAQAVGAKFVLTDDENYSEGPYFAIERGIIPGVEALAFWDLIYLNILSRRLHYQKAMEVYSCIAQNGYQPPYGSTFKSKIGFSIRRLKDKPWFNKWCINNRLTKQQTISLIKWLK